MKQTTRYALIAFFIAILAIASRARVYSGNYLRADSWVGVAWDIGGVELYNGRPAIFLCPANYDYTTGRHWDNPLAPLFPELVADC